MSADRPAIDMRPHDAALVRSILDSHVPEVDVWAFGSRATGKAKRYSDLDIALMSEQRMTFSALAALEAAFEDSDLPFKVDVVEIARVAPAFRSIIEATAVPFRSLDDRAEPCVGQRPINHVDFPC
jgi:predicted nucleotidyltransferase